MREYKTFGGFARHLVTVAAQGAEVEKHILGRATKIVRDDAQARIGTYQAETGPFNAWQPLASSTIADRINKGFTPNDPLLRSGELRDSITSQVHGDKAIVGSSSDIALYQELGTATIPPRPFLGPAAFASKAKIGAMAANTMVAWVAGGAWLSPPQSIKLP